MPRRRRPRPGGPPPFQGPSESSGRERKSDGGRSFLGREVNTSSSHSPSRPQLRGHQQQHHQQNEERNLLLAVQQEQNNEGNDGFSRGNLLDASASPPSISQDLVARGSGAFHLPQIEHPSEHLREAGIIQLQQQSRSRSPLHDDDNDDGDEFDPPNVSTASRHQKPDQQIQNWFRPLPSSSYDHRGKIFSLQEERIRSSSPTPGFPPSSSFTQNTSVVDSSPARIRPSSATSAESLESCESTASSRASSLGQAPPSSSRTVVNANRKVSIAAIQKKHRKSPPPLASEEESEEEETTEKSPLPQNLRGDPFRSAKVKTELCRHYGTEKGCPFGDKCNYAHGEHELKYTKLMDLERAGLVDIEIFRTHPCPTWVATGACPFDQRCSGLHDPRIVGARPSWLPHAETLINSIGSSVNVDKLYHQQLASVYSCSPIYGFIPRWKWTSSSESTRSAWNEFYNFVCNLKKNVFTGEDDDNNNLNISAPHMLDSRTTVRTGSLLVQSARRENLRSPEDYANNRGLPEIYRIAISLKMRENRKGQCYGYVPTHMFCGELCMVVQTRYFSLRPIGGDDNVLLGGGTHVIFEVSSEDFSLSEERNKKGTRDRNTVVVAREIAFGPVGDPSVREVSIWFDIPPGDISPCTAQQAKRHKRSRHRLKKSKQREKLKSSLAKHPSSPHREVSHDEGLRDIDSCQIPPFYNFQPLDNSAFDLISGILKHRLHVLTFVMSNQDVVARNWHHTQLLDEEENRLRGSFESQRRNWLTWSWPVCLGRDEIDDNTDVPPVNGVYHFALEDNSFQSRFFHGTASRQHEGDEIVSHLSRLSVGLLWKSFLLNMHIINSKGRLAPPPPNAMPWHDGEFHQLRRLPVFRSLSNGLEICESRRRLPTILQINRSLTANQEEGDGEKETTISVLLSEWEEMEAHYEKNHNSPLRQSQATKEAAHCDGTTTTTPSSEAIGQVGEGSLDDALNQAAKMWTRVSL